MHTIFSSNVVFPTTGFKVILLIQPMGNRTLLAIITSEISASVTFPNHYLFAVKCIFARESMYQSSLKIFLYENMAHKAFVQILYIDNISRYVCCWNLTSSTYCYISQSVVSFMPECSIAITLVRTYPEVLPVRLIQLVNIFWTYLNTVLTNWNICMNFEIISMLTWDWSGLNHLLINRLNIV